MGFFKKGNTKMVKKTIIFTLSIINLALFLCLDAFCDNNTLRGIKSVNVVIDLSSEEDGVSSYQLKNDVELKLRLAGIKVDPKSSQLLLVKVFIMKIEADATSHAFGRYGTVQIQMHEEVILLRNPAISAIVPTWGSHIYYLHGPPDTFGKRCRDAVRDFTDAFINDYLSVNPK